MKNITPFLIRLSGIIFLSFIFSCSSSPKTEIPKKDSVLQETVKAVSLTPEIGDIDSLLPHLPVLSFPLYVNSDSLSKNHGIAISMKDPLNWFFGLPEYPAGTTATALGKFNPDATTDAVLFRLSVPDDYPERGNNEELVITLFNRTGGQNDSRVMAVSGEVWGYSILRTPLHGNSFTQEEMEDISITFERFQIKDCKFVSGDKEYQRFNSDQKGSDASSDTILTWSKRL